jgi:hypothetical protein
MVVTAVRLGRGVKNWVLAADGLGQWCAAIPVPREVLVGTVARLDEGGGAVIMGLTIKASMSISSSQAILGCRDGGVTGAGGETL